MQNRNPYAAPRTNVASGASTAEEYGEIKVFSPHGRIGRVRYIGYSIGLTLLSWLVIGILAAIASLIDQSALLLVIGLGYVAVLAIQFLLTIQRSHDMNVTGWLSLIWLLPLGILVFWFVPGTRGENDYGKPPPPNTAGVIILTCLAPIFVVGILAAIAIPAYQDYTIRAQVSEGMSLAAAAKAAVAKTFLEAGVVPQDREDAGMSRAAADTRGKYVSSVEIYDGRIDITYGGEAHRLIAGQVLSLTPYGREEGENSWNVVWRCGYAPIPADATLEIAPYDAGTIRQVRYLPSACRPENYTPQYQ